MASRLARRGLRAVTLSLLGAGVTCVLVFAVSRLFHFVDLPSGWFFFLVTLPSIVPLLWLGPLDEKFGPLSFHYALLWLIYVGCSIAWLFIQRMAETVSPITVPLLAGQVILFIMASTIAVALSLAACAQRATLHSHLPAVEPRFAAEALRSAEQHLLMRAHSHSPNADQTAEALRTLRRKLEFGMSPSSELLKSNEWRLLVAEINAFVESVEAGLIGPSEAQHQVASFQADVNRLAEGRGGRRP